MSPLALSGLASGLDTESIITSLMTVERQPRTRLALADTQAQARQTALRELSAKLKSVRDAAAALHSTTTWADVQKVTSSDVARISVRAQGSVAPGARVLEVSSLAVTAQHAFAYATSATAQSITIGTFTLAVDPDTDVATVASAINDRDDAPASAVVAGGKLVLTSRTSGEDGDFSTGATPLLAEDPAYARVGADAVYTIDGVPKTSPSNVITDKILGAEITLKATTAAPVTIAATDPAIDEDAVKAKVTAFVTAYNSTVDHIRGKLAEKPVKDATTNADAVKGLFYGDTMLSGVLSSMRAELGDLADLGISTGAPSGTATFSADAVAGKLKVDDTKLAAALADDADGLRTRLQAFSDRLAAVVTPIAGARVDERLSSVDATRKRLADAMAATDVRLANKEQRLRAQFTAMESALSASQSAMAQLQSQLGSL
ncbi:MAG TPA: flagellar filament capping protein FliD [Solirubrobacteraceae bacterium]|nr:flagellar filament capping protein FliD [Solirubrobacteraceae bacterium]